MNMPVRLWNIRDGPMRTEALRAEEIRSKHVIPPDFSRMGFRMGAFRAELGWTA